MKYVFRALVFHLICIVIFFFIYWYLENHFIIDNKSKENVKNIDFLLLSTTIQTGVGLSDVHPVTLLSKICLIIQQLVMLSSHILTLYLFLL
jgi:hypothetical protein